MGRSQGTTTQPAVPPGGSPDDILMGRTPPASFRGPLDPARLQPIAQVISEHTPKQVNPFVPIENPSFPSWSDVTKYPVASAFNFLGTRIASGAAPTLKAVLTPGDTSLPQLASQTARGLLMGQPPDEGNPLTATYDVAAKYGPGLQLTPEQVDRADRAFLGLPIGEAARYIYGPGGIAALAEAPFGEIANIAGAKAIAPAARAVGKGLSAVGARQAFGIKQVGDLFSPGFSLGNDVRDEMRGMLRNMAGVETLGRATVAKEMAPYFASVRVAAKKAGETPVTVERRIREALEMFPKDKGELLSQLSPDEMSAASVIQHRIASDPNWRESVGLARFELGSHIPPHEALENVAFTKRITEQPLKEEFGPQYGTASGGLKTTPGTGRTASRELTTSQLEAQIAKDIGGKYLQKFQKGKVSGFKNIGESTLIGGERTAEKVSHARFLNQVREKFAKIPVDEAELKALRRQGYRPMSDLRGAPTGFVDQVKQAMGKSWLRPDQFEFMEMANKAFSPSWVQAQRGLHGRILRTLSNVPGNFKSWVLLRPGFISRNWQNNVLLSAMYGNVDPLNYAWAMKTYFSKSPESQAIMRKAILKGVSGSGQIAGETPRAFLEGQKGLGGVIGKGLTKFRNANSIGEDISKLSLWRHFIRSGLSESEAARKVGQILFWYTPRAFTPFERALRSTVLPFYAWRRQIVPLFFRTLGERPGAVGQYEAFRQGFNKEQGLESRKEKLLGPDVMSRGAFVRKYKGVRAKPGEFEVFPEGFQGLRDVSGLIGQEDRGVTGPIQRIVTDSYPWINTAITYLTPQELRGEKTAFGFDYYRGKALTNAPVRLPENAKLLPLLWPDLAKKMHIVIDPKSKLVYGPDRVNLLFRSVGPIPTMLADITSDDPQALRRARSYWTGISSMVRDTSVGNRIGASEKKKARDLKIQRLYQREYFLKGLRQPQK